MASASNSTTLNPYGYTLTASFNENSTSTPNNISNITCTATLQANGSYWSTSHASTLTIYWHDNREKYDRQVASTSFAGLGGGWDSKSCSGTIDVTHNDDGTLSGYAYAVFTKGSTSSGYAPNSGSVNNGWTALTSIPRASTPSIDGIIYTGTNCTVKTNRPSGTSFTHVLSYTFGSKTGYIADADHKAGASCTWSIPSNFAEEYASDVSSMNCTITCDTYSGSTKIGTKTYTKSITLNTDIVPTISSATSQDGNTVIRSLNLTVYLTGKSYPELSITASGIERSTISTYYAALNPADDTEAEANAVSATSVLDLNNLVKNFNLIAGTNTIKVWVADSRGYKSLKSSISILARSYTSPNIEDFSVARCKSSSNLEPDDEGTSIRLSAAGSITDILASNNSTHKNVMCCKTRYRQAPNGNWSDLTNLSGGVSGYSFNKTNTNSVNLAGTFPTTSKYDVEIYLYDTISLAESGWDGTISSNPKKPTEEQLAKLNKKTASILTGFDLMHFHKSGKSVSFGKKSEAGDNDKMFEIRMDDIKFEGDTYVNDYLLNDIPGIISSIETPVGTILPYSSSNAPSGYMICDGSAISREIYSELFNLIGETYGSGDGSTTFNLPNLKGRVGVGIDSGDTTFDTLGKNGGEKTHKLTGPESGIAAHSHRTGYCDFGACRPTYQADSSWATVLRNSNNGVSNHMGTTTAGDTSAKNAHNNLQPYIVINYIIKVSRGTATIPDSVIVTNTDVAQINQNKNDITELKNRNVLSTTEKIIGKWIDGRNLYQKVLTIDINASGLKAFNHGISNLDMMLNVTGNLKRSTGEQYIINRVASDSNPIGVNEITSTAVKLYIGTGFGTTITTGNIILEYVKTS